MKISSIEQELEGQGSCLIQTVGISMEPLLHNRYSTVVLEKIRQPLRRNDVVLFRRTPERNSDYVLHRIIEVRQDSYRIRGDNCMDIETVAPEQIIGVMTGFWNGETYVDCSTDEAYHRYVKTLGLRYCCRWCRALPGRVFRKLKRIFL